MERGAIGVVGGVGPYAGLDLVRKIFDQTEATRDQDHLPVMLYSLPDRIQDRTAYLLGKVEENPGIAIGEILLNLAKAGASVLGIPCNTAHSPRILEPALKRLYEQSGTRFVHMIDAVIEHIHVALPRAQFVGVLSTQGTYETGLYRDALEQGALSPMFPDETGRWRVQDAISNLEYGVKAQSSPVSEKAVSLLRFEAERLADRGADAVILGCTELPLAFEEVKDCPIPLIDTTSVLARALILAFAPERLKVC